MVRQYSCGAPHTKKCPFHPDREKATGGAAVLRTGLPSTYSRGPKSNLRPEPVFLDWACVQRWRKASADDASVTRATRRDVVDYSVGFIRYKKYKKYEKPGRPRGCTVPLRDQYPFGHSPGSRSRPPVARGNKGKSRELQWLQENAARWAPASAKRRRTVKATSLPEHGADGT